MGFPTDAPTSVIADKYQGVVIAEIACTLILYIVLRIIHFCIWGWLMSQSNQQLAQAKKDAEDDARRWDQESWDIYFPIIFANHVVALALPLLYTPSIFVCVLGFIHFALFVALVIINVFITDAEPGQGTRTSVSRIIWGSNYQSYFQSCVCSMLFSLLLDLQGLDLCQLFKALDFDQISDSDQIQYYLLSQRIQIQAIKSIPFQPFPKQIQISQPTPNIPTSPPPIFSPYPPNNKINKKTQKYIYKSQKKKSSKRGKRAQAKIMTNEINHKRTRSQFHKGMTLEQYLRGMDVNEQTIPTADSAVAHFQQEQESLYKTSHFFYHPSNHGNAASIREIQEENFQESLEQYRDCINIVSTNFKPINKKDITESMLIQDHKKNYRIRNGKSMSPYQLTLKQENKKTISPYKTYMKKFYNADQQLKNSQQNNLKQSNKVSMVRTLYGKQFDLRRSTKNIKVEPIPSFNHQNTLRNQDHFIPDKQQKLIDKPRISMKKEPEIQKFDIRIETLKDRLQMKRKNKNKV